MTPSKKSPAQKIQVFLVDDHPIVRRGLQLLISMERDLAVCGEADSGPAALEKILELRPDVVIVDLALKSSSGLELIQQLRAQSSALKMLVFSMRDEGVYAERALRAGANGYITKEEGAEKAIEAIRLLVRGKNYVSEKISARIVGKMVGGGSQPQQLHETLSDRELEVLEMLGAGLGSREIADKLNLSIKTIESHREHLKEKLGISSAPELVRYAFSWAQDRNKS